MTDDAPQSTTSAEKCPDCGAVNSPPAIFCWLCGRALPPGGEGAERPAVPPNANVTFSLSSLMLVMTLIAVCLGAATIEPGLGIILAIAATPAVLRTMVLMKWERQRLGHSASMLQKVLTFASSLFLLLVVATASFAAFFAMCTAGFAASGDLLGRGNPGVIQTFLALGIVASLVVLFFGLRWIWPRKNRARGITPRGFVNLAAGFPLLFAACAISVDLGDLDDYWIFACICLGLGALAAVMISFCGRGFFGPKQAKATSLISLLVMGLIGFVGQGLIVLLCQISGLVFFFGNLHFLFYCVALGIITGVTLFFFGRRVYSRRALALAATGAVFVAGAIGISFQPLPGPADEFLQPFLIASLALAAGIAIRIVGLRALPATPSGPRAPQEGRADREPPSTPD